MNSLPSEVNFGFDQGYLDDLPIGRWLQPPVSDPPIHVLTLFARSILNVPLLFAPVAVVTSPYCGFTKAAIACSARGARKADALGVSDNRIVSSGASSRENCLPVTFCQWRPACSAALVTGRGLSQGLTPTQHKPHVSHVPHRVAGAARWRHPRRPIPYNPAVPGHPRASSLGRHFNLLYR